MPADIKTELHIPDIWLDFYGRLIPGAAFLFAVRMFILGNWSSPELVETLLLLSGGYFIALLSTPISSLLKDLLFLLVKKITGKGDQFVATVQAKLGAETRRATILSKMHAECVFFVQLFVLSIIWEIIFIWYRGFNVQPMIIFIVVLIYLSFGAWKATKARIRKAELYNDE